MEKTMFRLGGAAVIAALALAATWKPVGTRPLIALLVGLPSFVLMIISRRQLGSAFSAKPEARALVTTGLYAKIMHPMYLFLDLFLIALIVLLGWPILVGVWGVLVIVQTLQARREEKVLGAAFADFEAYRNQAWF
jgi:protein-S-isoprenylcysteine O-methyltransferase Ste14